MWVLGETGVVTPGRDRMSGEVEATQADLDLMALESFLIGNRDLERLEALLDRFNILEALGVVRQELRHSDFLAGQMKLLYLWVSSLEQLAMSQALGDSNGRPGTPIRSRRSQGYVMIYPRSPRSTY